MAIGNFRRVFGDIRPVIGMVYLGALPGAPLHDAGAGLDGLVAGARTDLEAYQAAGFDALMFGNENDRPYEFSVDVASTAAMAFAIGRLKNEISVPFGVDLLWDPMSTVALAAATGADFVREIFTGAYAKRHGVVDAGRRRRNAVSGPAGSAGSRHALQRVGRVRLQHRPSPPARTGAVGGVLLAS